MSKIIIITGTPGAGKTTVLTEALKKIKAKISVINFGDAMLAIAKQDFGVQNRDEIRKLPLSTQRTIQTGAANQIAAKANELTIVDTHSSILTTDGYLPGIPEWIANELKPTVIILVETNPRQILKRRLKDKTRHRDKEAITDIEMQQQINRMFAVANAAMTGAAVKIIINADEKLDKAAEELSELINSQI